MAGAKGVPMSFGTMTRCKSADDFRIEGACQEHVMCVVGAMPAQQRQGSARIHPHPSS
jgi:hypothetical protein